MDENSGELGQLEKSRRNRSFALSLIKFFPRRWECGKNDSFSINIISVETRNFLVGGWKHLYSFCVEE